VDNSARKWITSGESPILVTGAAGFIGSRVVDSLMRLGFQNVRCFVRPSSNLRSLKHVLENYSSERIEVITGNLLSRADCARAAKGAEVVLHLVTGRGKSFPACFQNSVVTTRNLLDALVTENTLARFVNVSSYAVYSNFELRADAILDETCRIEDNLLQRHDAYVYAKLKQDELVQNYHERFDFPFVTVRPCVVFGTGRKGIPGAVGMNTFGFFMHLGGNNVVPLTYVDNCADAIVLAGLVKGIESQVYNVVDDDPPTSRTFLQNYMKSVGHFRSIPVPYPAFYIFCTLWELYAKQSAGQLPPVFNRRFCAFNWRGNRCSNKKIKQHLGWEPRVPMDLALRRYFSYQKNGGLANA
jgi:nucleoside-diphosphate-sugar epimerase